MNTMKNTLKPQNANPWNYVKVGLRKRMKLIKNGEVIPEEPSNSLYTFCNMGVMSIKKAKELKGSIDRAISDIDPMSGAALRLSKAADQLGLHMIKMANLSYKVSRNMEDYKDKKVDDFINCYTSSNKREVWEYKKKDLEEIKTEVNALKDLIISQARFYAHNTRVQDAVVKELESMYNGLSKSSLILETIKTNAVQSNE